MSLTNTDTRVHVREDMNGIHCTISCLALNPRWMGRSGAPAPGRGDRSAPQHCPWAPANHSPRAALAGLQIKFYRSTARPIHVHTVDATFQPQHITAELKSHAQQDTRPSQSRASKHCLVLPGRSLPTPAYSTDENLTPTRKEETIKDQQA